MEKSDRPDYSVPCAFFDDSIRCCGCGAKWEVTMLPRRGMADGYLIRLWGGARLPPLQQPWWGCLMWQMMALEWLKSEQGQAILGKLTSGLGGGGNAAPGAPEDARGAVARAIATLVTHAPVDDEKAEVYYEAIRGAVKAQGLLRGALEP